VKRRRPSRDKSRNNLGKSPGNPPRKGKRPDQAPRYPKGGAGVVVRYADAHIVVVDKPVGLTTMRHPEETAEFGSRARRFLPPTLADLLPGLLREREQRGAEGKQPRGKPTPRKPIRVIPVHRLDKETSGLVVFARTPEAARHIGGQFRTHETDRVYVALVRGKAQSGRIESRLVRDRGDGRRGSTIQPGEGQRAVTHVQAVEPLGDFTLVECRLETGRTHQVRIHLGEQKVPLCGERIYDRPLNGRPFPDGSGAKRPMLHAAVLGLTHPATGAAMRWESRLPGDMAELLGRLRRKRGNQETPRHREDEKE
jgi:23S rRNA pseudouridine1911/1915/1917 synthase